MRRSVGGLVAASLAICALGAGPSAAPQPGRWVETDLVDQATRSYPAFGGFSLVGMTARGDVLWTAYQTGGDQSLRDVFRWRKGTITDLGTLGRNLAPRGFNDDDEIVGTDGTGVSVPVYAGHPYSPMIHGFLWRAGKLTTLGPLGTAGEVEGINDRGQIVETAKEGSPSYRAVLWQRGKTTELGTLGGTYSVAAAIDAQGRVVGDSALSSRGDHAFLWQSGKMTDLGGPPGAQYQAVAINDRVQIVGRWAPDGHSTLDHAFLWRNGTLVDLGRASRDWVAINDRGQVILDRAGRGFIWQNGRATSLGTLGGATSTALAIDDAGQVVGVTELRDSTTLRPDQRAFIWQNGKMTRLPGPAAVGYEMAIDRTGTHIVLGGYCCGGQFLLWTRR